MAFFKVKIGGDFEALFIEFRYNYPESSAIRVEKGFLYINDVCEFENFRKTRLLKALKLIKIPDESITIIWS